MYNVYCTAPSDSDYLSCIVTYPFPLCYNSLFHISWHAYNMHNHIITCTILTQTLSPLLYSSLSKMQHAIIWTVILYLIIIVALIYAQLLDTFEARVLFPLQFCLGVMVGTVFP